MCNVSGDEWKCEIMKNVVGKQMLSRDDQQVPWDLGRPVATIEAKFPSGTKRHQQAEKNYLP